MKPFLTSSDGVGNDPFPVGKIMHIADAEEAVQYAMDDCISSGDFTKEQVIALARRYYSCARTENPLIEIVSDGENHMDHQAEY